MLLPWRRCLRFLLTRRKEKTLTWNDQRLVRATRDKSPSHPLAYCVCSRWIRVLIKHFFGRRRLTSTLRNYTDATTQLRIGSSNERRIYVPASPYSSRALRQCFGTLATLQARERQTHWINCKRLRLLRWQPTHQRHESWNHETHFCLFH